MEASHIFYDLLDLPPEATLEEIRKSYTALKNLYSGDSIEIAALNTDFSEELQQDFISRLDEAYEQIMLLRENKKPEIVKKIVVVDDGLREWIENINIFSGVALKSVRERMGVDIKDIFAATRIQPQYLDDIENERFGSFRAEVFLRSYIIEYARYLSLDTQRVLADYLPRYRKFQGFTNKIEN